MLRFVLVLQGRLCLFGASGWRDCLETSVKVVFLAAVERDYLCRWCCVLGEGGGNLSWESSIFCFVKRCVVLRVKPTGTAVTRLLFRKYENLKLWLLFLVIFLMLSWKVLN